MRKHILARLLKLCKKNIEKPSHKDDWIIQCGINNKQLVFGDLYFSSVSNAIETMKRYGRYNVGIVKTPQVNFLAKLITNKMKDEYRRNSLLPT